MNIVRKNITFINTKSYNILITATMSAGKSTLLNALVGKKISRMQNMACTSRIHTIISKPLEDGFISKDDYKMSVNASQEDLLNDNDDNKSGEITVATYFNSKLAGKRIVLFDSPGVNSSENIEHMQIAQQMIESQRYHLILYVLNATQLGTNDDEYHLANVKKHMGCSKIIFIMNKVDQLISDDENLNDIIKRQRSFLMSKGFENPIICPVSSRAAYLVKKYKQDKLSRLEQRELDNYIDKFEQQSLSDYYETTLNCLPIYGIDEVNGVFVNCGFAYLENILANEQRKKKKRNDSA